MMVITKLRLSGVVFSLICFITAHSQLPYKINLEFENNEIGYINCSEIIDQIEYVVLSTEKNSLIDRFPSFDILDNNIIVQTHRTCLVFDSMTGKFKNKISQRGKGPGEYRSTSRIVNHKENSIFFKGWDNRLFEYNINNELIRTIHIPFIETDCEHPSIPTVYGSDNDHIFCYYSNSTGEEKKLLAAVSCENSNVEFIIPNYNIFHNKPFKFKTKEALFYSSGKHTFFKEMYNDTVFKIIDGNLVPHLVFRTGKYHFPYEKKWEYDPFIDKYIFIHTIRETKKMIFFHFFLEERHLLGIYNKTIGKLKVTEVENGIINDIDDFLNFNIANTIPDEKLIGVIEAYEVLQWFKDNPEKAAKLPEHLQKLKNIKETDNPVIMIAKLKE